MSPRKDYAIHGHWPGTLPHLEGRVRRALPAPPYLHQSSPAEPETTARSGKHLCRREFFRAGIRPRRMARHLKRAELIVSTPLCRPSSGRQYAGWVIGFGLRRRGRCGRLLPTPASGLFAHGTALPGLRHSHPPHRCSRPGNPLLSPLPTLDFYEFQNDCPGKASINRKQKASPGANYLITGNMVNGLPTAYRSAASDARGSRLNSESGASDPASRAQVLPGPAANRSFTSRRLISAGDPWEASDWPSLRKATQPWLFDFRGDFRLTYPVYPHP